uniref:Phosphoribosyltransferase domain-containing protein n=1 Tax=Electrophorus electricus TaxID=8005 RepID=A0A4W4DSK4_ELEEL
ELIIGKNICWWQNLLGEGWPGYNLELFNYPEHYHGDIENVYIPHGVIMDRIESIARDILEDLGQHTLMVLCVLKGGYKFCADLVDSIKAQSRSTNCPLTVRVEFIRLKSYLNSCFKGIYGFYNKLISLFFPHAKQNVLIVEAIVGTGKTMMSLLKHVVTFQPKTIKVAGLLVKQGPNGAAMLPDYVGFVIPNHFVVGYALDYNEYFRDLDHICVISEKGKLKYKV